MSEYLKNYKKQYFKDHKQVNLTLTKNDHAKFKKLADKEGVGVATLIRNMAIAFRDTQPLVSNDIESSLADLSFLIRNIATNVNQIAHSSNVFHDAEKEMVLTHLKRLDESIREYTKGKLK